MFVAHIFLSNTSFISGLVILLTLPMIYSISFLFMILVQPIFHFEMTSALEIMLH